MVDVQHSAITDPNVHEPKGIVGASANTVYVCNGSNTGVWQAASTTTYGVVRLISPDVDITDNSGGTPSSGIVTMTNIDLLVDSSTGTADNTVAAISGSGADSEINNNFKELTDQVISQRTLNTQLINAVSALAAEINDLRAKMRTAGLLTT